MPRQPKPYLYRGWYCTDAGGTIHHKLSPESQGMVEARRQLRQYLHRLDQEREQAPTPGPGIRPSSIHPDCPHGRKVGQTCQDFLEAKKVESEPLTYKHYEDRLAPLIERFGNRVLASLTEQDGISYKRWLMGEKEWLKGKTPMKGLGPCTVNHHLRAAKTFLNWCAKPSRRYILYNPWSDLKYLKEQGRERIITDEEFASLLKHCHTCRYRDRADHDRTACSVCREGEEFRQILIVLRHTTMRPGELRALDWDEVDLDRHQVVIRAKKVKTRFRRPITLLPEVEAVLQQRKEKAGGIEARGLVFPSMSGEEWKRASFSQRFRRLRDRCVQAGEIRKEKGGEKLVLYHTRHTRITELCMEGHNQAVVMQEAGHRVPATTERYMHLADTFVTAQVREKARARPPFADEGQPASDPKTAPSP